MSEDAQLEPMPDLVIVTGMSGAGRTEAMHVFEDLGYFCVDNLPSNLIGSLVDLTRTTGVRGATPPDPNIPQRLAVVCDARNGDFFGILGDELQALRDRGIDYAMFFLDADDEKLVARYKSSRRRHPMCADGTSIAQGACASRPGMAWTNILRRLSDRPVVNLGFSGNGRLEQGVLDLMAELDARLYILGCLANLCGESPERLDSLITNAVSTLRAANDAPIIMFEHPGFSDAPVNSRQHEIIQRLNSTARTTYDKLCAKGIKDLYYITREEIGIPADGWVDDVHPSDLGMTAIANAVEKTARKALNITVGDISTAVPVTQRREAANYEWRERHRSVMAENKANPPRSVIIGNSITHFWGGKPAGHVINGEKTWKKHLAKAGFGNLGFGWDRIENALWRVYHGELDGYDAEQVVIMLGTNNYGINSPDEIAEGLRFLIRAIRDRQPKATIKMAGILPRRDDLSWVSATNEKIEAMARQEGCVYINPGAKMLNADGTFDESLFTDGLHPNDNGYARIVDDIVRTR